jgi:hypothetical protein
MAAAVRRAVPAGVDALVDAALIGPPALAAVRDGEQLIAVRPFAGDSERDITITLVLMANHVHNHTALKRLVDLAATGKLTPRVADTLPVEQVAEAHRRLEKDGVRGRTVVTGCAVATDVLAHSIRYLRQTLILTRSLAWMYEDTNVWTESSMSMSMPCAARLFGHTA